MNSPSPLVPQGAIPPKTTSRPQRVLMIGAMVVGLHVAGLSLVLFQGCGKEGAGTQSAGNTETNTTAGFSYPSADTNSGPMFAAASNSPAATIAAAQSNNVYVPPVPAPAGAFGAATSNVPANMVGATDPGTVGTPTPTSDVPVLAGNEKDYKIAKGDTLTTIASRNGVTLSAIMKVNPTLDPKKLRVGQSIKVPQPAAAATANVAAAGTVSTPPTTRAALGGAAGAATGSYKVKSGDTLTKIARLHGITVNELRAANNMKTTQVQVGKVLKIPAKTQRTAAAPTNSTTH
jgi:LysM repeat protein